MGEGGRLLSPSDLVPDEAIKTAADDRFDHEKLARVVADAIELQCEAETALPTGLTIALYAPWGAGKSGFLQLVSEILERETRGIKVIRYDAWKYEGDSLQRHFLTQVAQSLGVDEPNLRSVTEHKRADPQLFTGASIRQLARWVAGWLLAALVTATFVIAVLAIVAGLHRGLALHRGFHRDLTGGWHHFWHTTHVEWRRFATYFLAPVAAIALVASILRPLLEGALVTYRRDPPSDEEFERIFVELLGATEKNSRRWWKRKQTEAPTRFVFFVDELDRCGKTEVVATLHAVKNFLGRPECTFFIAADRDVLEDALTELPQSNPVNAEAPYYSSASEYLDKVFHLQLVLPPLRQQRRTQFAHDLTAGRSDGVWAMLEDDGTLDDLLFVLIPQFVESPRRIKTLLTNFALNARAAEARNFPWRARALEIAKLTALQTEFPLFARDLPLEPRLPEWLLLDAEPEGVTLTAQQRDLLLLHRLPPSEDEVAAGTVDDPDGDEEALSATDKILVEGRADQERLAAGQRRLLRRYLEDRERFPTPKPDLLYLDSAGTFFGLDDPVLSATVETEGPESPARLVTRLRGAEPAELTAAIRMLGAMIPSYRGPERENLVKALLEAAELLPRPLDPELARAVAPSLVQSSDVISEKDAPVAVEIGVAAQNEALVDSILGGAGTLDTPENAGRIALSFSELKDAQRKKVAAAVSELVSEEPEVLLHPLRALPLEPAKEMLNSVFPAVVDALEAEDADQVDQRVGALFNAVQSNAPPLHLELFNLLLGVAARVTGIYTALRQNGADALVGGSPSERASAALKAMRIGPPEDYAFWLTQLDLAGTPPFPDDDEEITSSAVAALTSIFTRLRGLDAESQGDLRDLIERIASVANLTAEALEAEELVEAVTAAVGAVRWEGGDDAARTQLRIHEAVRALAQELPEALESVLDEDLIRVTSPPSAPVPGHSPPPSYAKLIAPVAVLAPPPTMEAVAEAIAANRTDSPDRTASLVQIAAALVFAGRVPKARHWFDLTPAQISSCLDSEGWAPLAEWLSTEPPAADVAEVVKTRPAHRAPLEAVRSWGKAASSAEKTALVEQLLSARPDASPWIGQLSDYDEVAALTLLKRLVQNERHQPARASLVESLKVINPKTPAGLALAADALISLFQQGTKSDFAVAVETLPIFKDNGIPHGKGQILRDAITNTARKHGLKVPRSTADAIGLRLGKRQVSDG